MFKITKRERYTTQRFPSAIAAFSFIGQVFVLMIITGILMIYSINFKSIVLIIAEFVVGFLLFLVVVYRSLERVVIYYFYSDYIQHYDASTWATKKNERILQYTNLKAYYQPIDFYNFILKDDENNAVILICTRFQTFDFIINNMIKYQYEAFLQRIENQETLEFGFHDMETLKILDKSNNAAAYFQNDKKITINNNFMKINDKTFSWNDVKKAKANLSYNIKVLHYLYDEIQSINQIENYAILDKLITDLQAKAPIVYIN
ncbi:hypothetical protein [Soonwooa sp.]|uniref:hypothetical protein n=1 Tax=Soonwooa sp. TaxID=1938592 RepID=UPI002639CA57|nr:hypothetical protein [Soonwooa sp.]